MSVKDKTKLHPWRVCPHGYHFVNTHDLHTPPGKDHPHGLVVKRHEHCAKNPHHKDVITFSEIKLISEKHFEVLNYKLGTLPQFPDSGRYDREIIGWVHYWNEVFHFNVKLEPNLVKALMATESSFQPGTLNHTKSKELGNAHGLVQIIDQTYRVLSDHKGELSDHLINLSKKELAEPSANICAAVRWLFQKHITATTRLGRETSWIEAVCEYKGILNDYNNDEPNAVKIINRFIEYYSTLKEKQK